MLITHKATLVHRYYEKLYEKYGDDKHEESEFFRMMGAFSYRENHEIIDKYLSIIIKHFKDNPIAVELFKKLEINGTFKFITHDDDYFLEATYNDKDLDTRLDLKEEYILGFSSTDDGLKQLSLAVLSKATSDKSTINYYSDFVEIISEKIKGAKSISQLEIILWLIEKQEQDKRNPVENICRALKITQKELAVKMGVSEGTVNRWTSKPENIPTQTIYMFSLLKENIELREQNKKIKELSRLLNSIDSNQNEGIINY